MNPTSTITDQSCRPDRPVPSSVLNPPLLTGVSDGLWHAVERIVPPLPAPPRLAVPVQGVALCGLVVRVAQKYGRFDRRQFLDRTCPTCAWIHALRTGTETAELAVLTGYEHTSTVDAQLELELRVPLGAAARVAAAILAVAGASGSDDDREDPAIVQLLATVTAHAPTALLAEECAEGGCEHDVRPCPPIGVACPACSVRAGGWAGEWEGGFRPECTIAGPCEVLRALAAHHHVELVGPSGLPAGREETTAAADHRVPAWLTTTGHQLAHTAASTDRGARR
ncbi:hypothetical protein ACU61A_40820 [Pseudonocardia sichuanensis]